MSRLESIADTIFCVLVGAVVCVFGLLEIILIPACVLVAIFGFAAAMSGA